TAGRARTVVSRSNGKERYDVMINPINAGGATAVSSSALTAIAEGAGVGRAASTARAASSDSGRRGDHDAVGARTRTEDITVVGNDYIDIAARAVAAQAAIAGGGIAAYAAIAAIAADLTRAAIAAGAAITASPSSCITAVTTKATDGVAADRGHHDAAVRRRKVAIAVHGDIDAAARGIAASTTIAAERI